MFSSLSQFFSADAASLLACLVWQIVSYILIGESFGRAVSGFSPCRHRLPELAFVLGLPVYGVAGYLLLVFSGTARVVAPVLLCLALAVLFLKSGRQDSSPVAEAFTLYASFRETRWGQTALLAIVLFALLIGFYRVPWLIHLQGPAGTVVGTSIFPDEMRTLGIPLSLAAHGFPVRFPVATETIDSYPLAAFVYGGAQIAWLRTMPLAVLVADSVAATAFYGLVTLFVVTAGASSAPARLLAVLSAVFSVSFNLWNLSPSRNNPIFNKLWGYYTYNQMYTTIAWTPVSGLLWIMNHALAFTAAVAACFWFACFRDRATHRIAWAPALTIGCFAMTSSVDMAVMIGCAVGAMLVFHLLVSRARGRPKAPWFWPAAGVVCASSVAIRSCQLGVRHRQDPIVLRSMSNQRELLA
jgi:hypothetical protein